MSRGKGSKNRGRVCSEVPLQHAAALLDPEPAPNPNPNVGVCLTVLARVGRTLEVIGR